MSLSTVPDEDVRDLLLSWNRACVGEDTDALTALSDADVLVAFEGREYRGAEGLARFADALSREGLSSRIHTTHMVARSADDGVLVRSFVMIVQRSEWGSHADGSPWPTWLGWSDDTVRRVDGRAVLVRRDLHPWTGDTVSGFGIDEAELT